MQKDLLSSWRLVACVLASAAFLVACGGGGVEQPNLPSRIVLLSAFPPGIAADGSEASQVTVTVLTAGGSAFGSARVELATNVGVLGFEGEQRVERTTANDGIIILELRGNGIAGIATVQATSTDATAFAEVLVF